MVNRRLNDSTTPCTVVDLDGTYIDGNTLRIYLACGLRYLAARFRVADIMRLTLAVGRRKAGRSSHHRMKEDILSVLYRYPDILNDFTVKTLRRINPAVKALIDKQTSRGHRILLATAAPSFYVDRLWHRDYVATQFQPSEPMIECVGEEKLSRVKAWLDDNNCHLDTVVTDHSDDAPLIAYNSSGTNVLVNPSPETLRFFRQLEPAHFLLIEQL